MENRRLKSKLTSVGAEHEAAMEIAESLTKAIEEKLSEVADLKKNKIEIEEKLLVLDIQVSLFKHVIQAGAFSCWSINYTVRVSLN